MGGVVKNLDKLIDKMRAEVIEQAKGEAERLGANAIVGVRMETNSVLEGTLEVVLYGTAVKFDK